jgi:hypothetical protein
MAEYLLGRVREQPGTKAGERRLGIETEQWTTISRAVGHALKTA